MKQIMAALSIFIYMNTSFALSNADIPDEMYIKEHWISLTKSFDIETKTEKLGTLYKKFFSLVLTYEFYDPFDIKQATAKSKFFSLTAHFDVYDNNDELIGVAEEKMFSFFPTFDIYAKDPSIKLAKAKLNFWGTTFTIEDPSTNKEMATMHRSFIRMKNDWSFKITDRNLFLQKNIDPRVLMTVIAFQGDRETWDTKSFNTLNKSEKPSEITQGDINGLLEKINTLSQQKGLNTIKNTDEKSLEALADELEGEYNNSSIAEASARTNKESLNEFINYCLNKVQSNVYSDEKNQAILLLLKMRLESELV